MKDQTPLPHPAPQERKRAPGAGRKPISQDGAKVIRARVTQEQYEMWAAMPNASEWLRNQLDKLKTQPYPPEGGQVALY